MKKTPKKSKPVVLKDLKDIPPVTPPKSKASKEKKPTLDTKLIRHDFTMAERDTLGTNLAVKMNELNLIEGERKQIADDYKAKISTIESEAANLGSKIRAGYELRPTQVYVRFFPKENVKRFYMTDSKKAEPVGQENMTSMDHQFCLDLPPSPPKPTTGVLKDGTVAVGSEAISVDNDNPESGHTAEEK